MSGPLKPTPYGIRRSEAWLARYGAAAAAMPTEEMLASYAAPLEQAVDEAEQDVEDAVSDAMVPIRRELSAALGDIWTGNLALGVKNLADERDLAVATRTDCESRLDSIRLAVRAALGGPCGDTVEDDGVRATEAHVGHTVESCLRGGRTGASEPDLFDEIVAESDVASPGFFADVDAAMWRRAEDRIVERVLAGVADMTATVPKKGPKSARRGP